MDGVVMMFVSIKSVGFSGALWEYVKFDKSNMCKIIIDIRLVGFGWLKIKGCSKMNENIQYGYYGRSI